MFTSSPGCQNQTAKSSKVQRQFQILVLQVLHSKALQALKETPEVCHFFNAINFHRFREHLLKSSSPQLNDQTDSDYLISTLLLHLINQDHSLYAFNDQNNTDAENLTKRDMINVSSQTELDTSSHTEVFPTKGSFSNLERFLNQAGTEYSSLNFDADDDFSPCKMILCMLTTRILTMLHPTLRLFLVKNFLQ